MRVILTLEELAEVLSEWWDRRSRGPDGFVIGNVEHFPSSKFGEKGSIGFDVTTPKPGSNTLLGSSAQTVRVLPLEDHDGEVS